MPELDGLPLRKYANGETFLGRYEVTGFLGEGGFATVYAARDLELHRRVAIKILQVEGETNESRFLREARTLANLRNPHTVTLFDFGRTEDGGRFMVFEFIEGSNLAVLSRKRRLDSAVAIHIAAQILESLEEAHRAGLLHRDVKPGNVMVFPYMDDPWNVKLLDFGITKQFGEEAVGEERLTATGAVVGTPRYMAPEQLWDSPLGPATDIYAVGLVLLEMLVGSEEFSRLPSYELMRRKAEGQIFEMASELSLSASLRGVLERMLDVEASRRYQSAGQAAAVLRKTPEAAEDSTPTEPSRPAETAPPTPSSSPVVPLAVALLVAACLFGAGIWWLAPTDGARRSLEAAPPARTPSVAAIPSAVSGEPTDEPADDELPVEPPAEPEVVEDRELCGSPTTYGTSDYELRVRSQRRKVTSYVPDSYTRRSPHPLVVVFHDRAQTASTVLTELSLVELAEEHGAVLMALEATDTTFRPWHDLHDREALPLLLRDAAARFCVDPDRILAIGQGVGGRMAEFAMCDGLVSVLATNAFRGDVPPVCVPEEPVPQIHFSGDRNRYLPVEGGKSCTGLTIESQDDKVQWWRDHFGCSDEPRVWRENDHGTCMTQTCGGVPYVDCRVRGGTGWPGMPRLLEIPGCNGPPTAFPVREAVWEFFEQSTTGE